MSGFLFFTDFFLILYQLLKHKPMPLSNLNNAHLTQVQVTAAQDALTALENALSMLTVTLTASERSTY